MLFPQQCWEENNLSCPVYCKPNTETFIYLWQSCNWANFCECVKCSLFSPTFRETIFKIYQKLNSHKILHWKNILVHARSSKVQSSDCNSDWLKHMEKDTKLQVISISHRKYLLFGMKIIVWRSMLILPCCNHIVNTVGRTLVQWDGCIFILLYITVGSINRWHRSFPWNWNLICSCIKPQLYAPEFSNCLIRENKKKKEAICILRDLYFLDKLADKRCQFN